MGELGISALRICLHRENIEFFAVVVSLLINCLKVLSDQSI